MKHALRLSLFAAIAVAFGAHAALPSNAPASGPESQVRISKMQARQIALDRSPQGAVKSEKLEQRGDRQMWVVDIARYREPKHVTTVLVDANTGAVESGTPHAPKK
jgi:uncharacterized membrane protein YkoI